MKQLILLVFMISLHFSTIGQSPGRRITGKVADSVTGVNLSNATVQLMQLKDSVIICKTLSQPNGFILSRIPTGTYQLSLSYIGYLNTAILIRVSEEDTLINTGMLHMRKASAELMEVVVRAVIPPVIVKSDTIVYNTEAFKTKPNATVAELLKQLPGMEVDKEGNVSFLGEKVQKIYIDGKEFFLNDPKLATQNLLADMVKKVEAFDDKTEKAKRTGIPDDNPGKAINLRLKDDKKKGLTGAVEAGYGSQNRYGIKSTANHFIKDAFTSGAFNRSNGGNLLNESPGLLNNQQDQITLVYRNKLTQSLQLVSDYSFNNNNSRSEFSNSRETFLADSSLLQDRLADNASKNINHRFSSSLNWTIDTANFVNTYLSFGSTRSESSNIEDAATSIKRRLSVNNLNNALTDSRNKFNSVNGSISVSYSHMFPRKGRYLGLSISNGFNTNDGRGHLQSLTRLYDGNGWPIDSLEREQINNSDGHGYNLGVGINYTEPIGKHQVLDFGWNVNSSNSKAARHTYNYDPFTGKYNDEDSVASNAFRSKNRSHQFSFGYNYFKNKLHYQLGMTVSKNKQENMDQKGNGADINQEVLNVYPRASVIYNISKQKNLQISYNGSTRQPTISELQPVPDYSNPLLIRLGNPILKQEFSNNVSFNYRYFSTTRSRSFMWQGQFRNTDNKIVNATVTNAQGIQEQRNVNVQGNYSASSIVSYGLPFGKNRKFGGLNSSTRINYDQDVNWVNGIENKKRSWQMSQDISVNYHKDDKIFAGVNASINCTRAKYSIQTMNATNFLFQNYSCNLSYEIFESVVVSSIYSMSFSNSQGALKGRNAKVWNASAMKRLFKNKAELKLSVFDILNDNNSFNQVTGDNYIETSEQEVMKRIFVLSFMYRFSKMN